MKRSLVLIMAVGLVMSGCATRRTTPLEEAPEATFPVTISAANGEVTIEERPDRIVSLSATATEMLFAIAAGPQVVAVDDQSNYPPNAPKTDLSGFTPNVEAIAGFQPDLVIFSFDPGELDSSLKTLGIPALLQTAAETLAGTYEQIRQLGLATGNPGEAGRLVTKMRTEIEEIVGSAPEFDQPPTYYHELDTTFFSATSATFIGQVYSLLGLKNIADQADKDGSGYPQLSAEYIVQANPDLIFLADVKCCQQTAATVAARPGWSEIDAVKQGGVVELDDDIASRWGPRIVDFLRTVSQKLESVSMRKAA